MKSPNDSPASLFTIGHSDHDSRSFLALLTRHGVQAIADVRSHPYSRFHPQFNRETIAASLRTVGIQYVFLGRELGARRAERESYEGRTARYDRIVRLPAFQEGLQRIRRGATLHRIAMLCAEKDPITCHRTVLVCRHLRADALRIRHILEDGSLESPEQAEERMIAAVGLPDSHLFLDRAELVEQAYDLQGERIAYTEADSTVTLDESA